MRVKFHNKIIEVIRQLTLYVFSFLKLFKMCFSFSLKNQKKKLPEFSPQSFMNHNPHSFSQSSARRNFTKKSIEFRQRKKTLTSSKTFSTFLSTSALSKRLYIFVTNFRKYFISSNFTRKKQGKSFSLKNKRNTSRTCKVSFIFFSFNKFQR